MGILSAPLRILRYVDQQIRLYNEHGPHDAGLPRALLDAAQIAIANGDLVRAQILLSVRRLDGLSSKATTAPCASK
jgi:hypothetical protein